VHVAGTKGKGTTCAYVDSILAQYRKTHGRPSRIGLLTSPHLIAVRERIRINSVSISEDMFARYFFEVWDRLGSKGHVSDIPTEPEIPALGSRPLYSRFIALLSYHVFLSEGVDVAVYETGTGGEFDATNVVLRPVATGISSLGMDHVQVLGNTIDQIAWHKAGTMKPGSPAFTVEQPPAGAEVLQARAEEKGVNLKVLDIDPRLRGVKIRPDAEYQKKNASLGIALAETALAKLDPTFVPSETTLPVEFVDGLENMVWRGRFEIVEEGNVAWHVDGAHTDESLKLASQWFTQERAKRYVISRSI